MSETDHGREWTNHELRVMDEATARQTLPVAQFERWERLQELYEEAEKTKAEWADQAETVEQIVVHADAQELGTELEVFGNDVLVHVDSSDEAFVETAERVKTTLDTIRESDTDGENEGAPDPTALDSDAREVVADGLCDLFDLVLVRWNDHEWDVLSPDARQAVLQRAHDKWGVDGLLLAWLEVVSAVAEDRSERVEVIEKFRDPTRRGNR